MTFLLLSIFTTLTLLVVSDAGPLERGSPGIPWTDEQASIIKDKLITLWGKHMKYTKSLVGTHFKDADEKLEPYYEDAYDGDWLYDPTKRLTTVDCDDSQTMCRTYWGDKRVSNLGFSPTKAIRLAFHDCVPYEDGTGGCDGCLNFDDNLAHNNVLQPTVALLEKVFHDKDFPTKTTPSLEDSPKNLGMSRADLWSFAGLVALDQVQEQTENLCSQFAYNFTCNDWDTPCYSPFPGNAKQLFKTGRTDCTPKYPDSKWEYVASDKEAEPDHHGTGPIMAQYFRDNFNLSPRQGLALMGAHTLGQFSTFSEHIDYAWVRGQGDDSRNELFNNEYYKTLVGKPAHVKDKYCTGQMDGSAPVHQWAVRANLFETYWPQDATGSGGPWIERKRRLLWNHLVTRAPTCEEPEEDALGDGGKFWNEVDCDNHPKCRDSGVDFQLEPESHFWEYCCHQKKNECWKTDSCDEDCTRTVQNRIRHLGSDVGFYFKFEYDSNGYPKMKNADGSSCAAFKNMGGKWRESWWLYKFDKGMCGEDVCRTEEESMRIKYASDSDNAGEDGIIAGCPLQDMLDGDEETDGHSQPIYQTVELYADDQDQWIGDFTGAWEIMGNNGYADGELVQGPGEFWSDSFAL